MNRNIFRLIVSLLLFALVGCSSSSFAPQNKSTATPIEPSATPKPVVSCLDEDVVQYLDDLDLLLEEFDDTVTLAGSTSRMGLAPVIQNMQSQKREARHLDRPECANYLQDLVVVSMETEIDTFISFLSNDSDTVVARKMAESEKVRNIVDDEIAAFRNDAMAAYEASVVTAESLIKNTGTSEPFSLPDDWKDITFPDSNDLVLSIPQDWTQSTFGDEGQYLNLKNDDKTMTVVMDILEEKTITEVDSDRARLFSLQTILETEDWDFYLEHNSEVGLYALNKGYVVEFSRRVSSSGDIEDGIYAIIVTPDKQEVIVIVNTERNDFAQIDLLTLELIYGSIRLR
jgi:hypothetical protein